MTYGGMNQVAVTADPVKALVGMLADGGPRDLISRTCAVAAIKPGRFVVGNSETCEPPDAASDVSTVLGVSVYNRFKPPLPAADGTQYAIGDVLSLAREGRIWMALKTGSPVAGGAVYMYVGGTAADRGMVSPTAAAGYVLVPGVSFTGKLETTGADIAEVQLGDAIKAGQQSAAEQSFTGNIVAGVCTINTGLRVTADSKATFDLSEALATTTNAAYLAHTIADNVAGEPGTGSITIRVFTAANAADVDAAGTLHGVLRG